MGEACAAAAAGNSASTASNIICGIRFMLFSLSLVPKHPAALPGWCALRRRRAAIHELAQLTHKLVVVAHAAQHNAHGLVGIARFQCEVKNRVDVAIVVGSPVEEIVMAEVQQLAHEPNLVASFVQ